MPDRLTRRDRLQILAELCPKLGSRRACDSSELARAEAVAILGGEGRAEVSADYVLMRAVDRFAASEISLEDLYRCRVLAYYMTFATGGEEWERWGIAAAVRPGDFEPLPDDIDLESIMPSAPDGPPWRSSEF